MDHLSVHLRLKWTTVLSNPIHGSRDTYSANLKPLSVQGVQKVNTPLVRRAGCTSTKPCEGSKVFSNFEIAIENAKSNENAVLGASGGLKFTVLSLSGTGRGGGLTF